MCLDRVWDSDVRASDAAPHGLGVCKSVWARRSVVDVGRVAERWWYHMGVADARNPEFCEEELPSSVSPDWQAVPARLMTEDRWQTVYSHPVASEEPIHVQEGWAGLWVLKHLCRSVRRMSRKH